MIKIHDSTGRVILLNPAAIESIREAGPSSSQTRSYIRTITGEAVMCVERVDTIENMIAMDQHKENRHA